MGSSSKNITRKQKDKFLEAYKKSLGNISTACRAAGFARGTFYRSKEKDAEFREQVEELNGFVGDFVESKLVSRINKGDTTATIFYCKTKLKDRGYIETVKTEHTGNKAEPIHTVNTTTMDVKSYKEVREEILDEV